MQDAVKEMSNAASDAHMISAESIKKDMDLLSGNQSVKSLLKQKMGNSFMKY
jgi:hypothetical protein